MATGDYPRWVYDPKGINPPFVVQDDPSLVALLTAPVPITAQPSFTPTTDPAAPVTVTAVMPVLVQVDGATQPPVGAALSLDPSAVAPTEVLVGSPDGTFITVEGGP